MYIYLFIILFYSDWQVSVIFRAKKKEKKNANSLNKIINSYFKVP